MALQPRHRGRPPYWDGGHTPKTDHGERYIVRYVDGLNTARVWGYTNDVDEARRWLSDVKGREAFSGARIEDRGERT